MELAEGTPLGNYIVGPPIGAGGMAVVFRARHAVLGTDHALKLILLPKVRERVLREGRIQAALHHPNIVAVTDVVVFRGAPGLVLEYVHGPTVERLLARHPKLSFPQIDAIAAGLFDGIAEAHLHHLVHRDLKPANILLQQSDSGFFPKIADFGLVKVVEGQRNTRTGAAMGTPSYMAPEQFRDTSGVDHRADLFALGCVLYELLTGTKAFPGEDLIALHHATNNRGYTPILELRPDAPRAMVLAIEAALSPDPDDRPADAGVLRRLWFDDRTVSDHDGVWPREWLVTAFQPLNPTLPQIDTWDESTTDVGVAPPGLPTLEQLPVRRLNLTPVWVGGLLAVILLAGWWAMLDHEPAAAQRTSALGLHPADTLAAATAGRPRKLPVVVGPMYAVGVDAPIAGAIERAIAARLGTAPAIEVRPAPSEPPTDPVTSAAWARDAGAEVALRGAVGKRGGNTLVSLERIDAASGAVGGRGFVVISPGEDLGSALEFLAATVLSRDPEYPPESLLESELAARRAELSACLVSGRAAEIRWKIGAAGEAELTQAPDRIEACVRDKMAGWLLPTGERSVIAWTLER